MRRPARTLLLMPSETCTGFHNCYTVRITYVYLAGDLVNSLLEEPTNAAAYMPLQTVQCELGNKVHKDLLWQGGVMTDLAGHIVIDR
jgi:hypothetical protein